MPPGKAQKKSAGADLKRANKQQNRARKKQATKKRDSVGSLSAPAASGRRAVGGGGLLGVGGGTKRKRQQQQQANKRQRPQQGTKNKDGDEDDADHEQEYDDDDDDDVDAFDELSRASLHQLAAVPLGSSGGDRLLAAGSQQQQQQPPPPPEGAKASKSQLARQKRLRALENQALRERAQQHFAQLRRRNTAAAAGLDGDGAEHDDDGDESDRASEASGDAQDDEEQEEDGADDDIDDDAADNEQLDGSDGADSDQQSDATASFARNGSGGGGTTQQRQQQQRRRPAGGDDDADEEEELDRLAAAAAGGDRSSHHHQQHDAAAAAADELELRLLLRRQRRLARLKETLATLCGDVLQDPEKHLARLGELVSLLDDNADGGAAQQQQQQRRRQGQKPPRQQQQQQQQQQQGTIVCEGPTERQLVLLSTCAVFCDVLPGYRIQQQDDQQQDAPDAKLSKEVRRLRGFEAALLGHYRRFLLGLERLAPRAPSPRSHHHLHQQQQQQQQPEETSAAAAAAGRASDGVDAASVAAVRCAGQLLQARPHFNFRSNLVQLLVPLMAHRHPPVRSAACAAIGAVFAAADPTDGGELSLEAARAVAARIKLLQYAVPADMLAVFDRLDLHLAAASPKDAGEDDRKDSTRKGDKKNNKAAKKEEKKTKKEERKKARKGSLERDVEKELSEADASGAPRHIRQRNQTELLKTVLLTYFRVLKRARNSPLLPAVLTGLARRAHLINVELVTDLFATLRQLLVVTQQQQQQQHPASSSWSASGHDAATADTADGSPSLSLGCRLSALLAACRLLRSHESLNVDVKDFYTHLYGAIPEVAVAGECDQVPAVLECCTALLLQMKQLSIDRLAAFAKRLATLALHVPPNAALGLLCLLHALILKYPRIQPLFDPDSEPIGSGVYLPDVPDPEHCNAMASSALYELAALQLHYHPSVARGAAQLATVAAAAGGGGGGGSGSRSGGGGPEAQQQQQTATQTTATTTLWMGGRLDDISRLLREYDSTAGGFNIYPQFALPKFATAPVKDTPLRAKPLPHWAAAAVAATGLGVAGGAEDQQQQPQPEEVDGVVRQEKAQRDEEATTRVAFEQLFEECSGSGTDWVTEAARGDVRRRPEAGGNNALLERLRRVLAEYKTAQQTKQQRQRQHDVVSPSSSSGKKRKQSQPKTAKR